MIAPIAQASSSQTGQTSSASTTNPPTVDKNMFMQLLVAQLKNQDPLNPTDSSQFVTQLAQFQQLEQTTNSAQDLSAMHQDLDKIAAAYTTSSSSTS
jgi:flagellar basal-body rod modification protein FlgD